MKTFKITSNIEIVRSLIDDPDSVIKSYDDTARIIKVFNHLRRTMKVKRDTSLLIKKLGREKAFGLAAIDDNCIEVDPRVDSLKSLVGTMCHEMVHMEQYSRKQFWTDMNYFYWKDSSNVVSKYNIEKKKVRRLDTNELNDLTLTYKELPWEEEAYRREKDILLLFGF
jgi:hypothetical protein